VRRGVKWALEKTQGVGNSGCLILRGVKLLAVWSHSNCSMDD
jgi:hypothetical protein